MLRAVSVVVFVFVAGSLVACDHGDAKSTADFSGTWTCSHQMTYKFAGQVDKTVSVESTRTNVQHGAKLESTTSMMGVQGCATKYSVDGNAAVVDPGQTCTL